MLVKLVPIRVYSIHYTVMYNVHHNNNNLLNEDNNYNLKNVDITYEVKFEMTYD